MREQHSVQFNARVIHDVEAEELSQEEIATKYRINQSLVSEWMESKAKIMAAAVDANKKVLKIRKGSKHIRCHSILFTNFKEARYKGYCVDFDWLWSKARVTQR